MNELDGTHPSRATAAPRQQSPLLVRKKLFSSGYFWFPIAPLRRAVTNASRQPISTTDEPSKLFACLTAAIVCGHVNRKRAKRQLTFEYLAHELMSASSLYICAARPLPVFIVFIFNEPIAGAGYKFTVSIKCLRRVR